MALQQEDLDYIKEHLSEWLAECSLGKPPAVYEIELRERMVRVEEELKHQRELIKEILVVMDKRFDAMQVQMDKRFEAVDKRFEAVDKRFEAMQVQMDKRFDALTRRIDRFMIWSFGITVSSAGVVIAVLRFWPAATS
jgi:hypothetical protein